MPIPIYLAMTSAEFYHCDPIPEKVAWMACHFSPYGTGLSNLPPALPEGSLLILNDRMPPTDHDPALVADTLAQVARQHRCAGILLDLQQPGQTLTTQIAEAVCNAAPCPVAVTEYYCQGLDCAVFLSPPLHIPLAEYLASWQGRDIWLEGAVEDLAYVITQTGCHKEPLPCPPADLPHEAPGAFSRYHIVVEAEAVRFSFRRSREDVAQMATQAQAQCMVGLYQQLK